VIAVVEPFWKTRAFDLKQEVEVSALQSKNPLKIVTDWSLVVEEERSPAPIPEFGDNA
jgi:hypothetical protein